MSAPLNAPPVDLSDGRVNASGMLRPHDEYGVHGDRDHLLERLQNLRKVLPVFATELASARRQAAQLRMENQRLLERVRQLQAKSSAPGRRVNIGDRPRRDA